MVGGVRQAFPGPCLYHEPYFDVPETFRFTCHAVVSRHEIYANFGLTTVFLPEGSSWGEALELLKKHKSFNVAFIASEAAKALVDGADFSIAVKDRISNCEAAKIFLAMEQVPDLIRGAIDVQKDVSRSA